MANTRIKDLNNTATTVPSDAYVAIDGSANGTAKISRDNLRQDTADAIAAAPSTYNLAPLTSGSVDVDKGGTGSTTLAGAKTNLEIINVGTAANEVPLNGMLGSMAYKDYDAHYAKGTWTGSIEFGGASAGQTYGENNCNYTVTGNVVHVQGIISLSAKGSSSGTARIAGLPFTSSSATSQAGLSINYGTGFASLTSLPSALVSGSATTALLSNWGASGVTVLTEANFTDATSIRFSGTYQIA